VRREELLPPALDFSAPAELDDERGVEPAAEQGGHGFDPLDDAEPLDEDYDSDDDDDDGFDGPSGLDDRWG
jgi:hypothetical protein